MAGMGSIGRAVARHAGQFARRSPAQIRAMFASLAAKGLLKGAYRAVVERVQSRAIRPLIRIIGDVNPTVIPTLQMPTGVKVLVRSGKIAQRLRAQGLGTGAGQTF